MHDGERRAQHGVEPVLRDVIHEKHTHAEFSEQRRLGGLEAAHADQAYVLGSKLRLVGQFGEQRFPMAEQTGERHAVQHSARRGLGSMRVHMGVDPDESQRAARFKTSCDAFPRADCTRVIAAEDHGKIAAVHDALNPVGEPPAYAEHRLQIITARGCARVERVDPGRPEPPPVQPRYQLAALQRLRGELATRIARAVSARNANDLDGPDTLAGR